MLLTRPLHSSLLYAHRQCGDYTHGVRSQTPPCANESHSPSVSMYVACTLCLCVHAACEACFCDFVMPLRNHASTCSR